MSENLDKLSEHSESVIDQEVDRVIVDSVSTDDVALDEDENFVPEISVESDNLEAPEIAQSETPSEPEVTKVKVRTTKGTPRKSKVEDADAVPRETKPKSPTLKEKREKEKREKEQKQKESEKNFFEPVPTDENYIPGSQKKWYILKVQANREEAVMKSLQRRAAIAGYEAYFGDILIPTEKVTDFRGGKKKVTKTKLYPGYLVVSMEITEETWFLVRETPGIGDFAGALGRPTPILEHEVQKILNSEHADAVDSPKLKINFQVGDKIKVKEGTFENFEGDVHQIDLSNGCVTVMINIFGRSTPVKLEYWQIEAMS